MNRMSCVVLVAMGLIAGVRAEPVVQPTFDRVI